MACALFLVSQASFADMKLVALTDPLSEDNLPVRLPNLDVFFNLALVLVL